MPKPKQRPALGGGTRKANAEEWARVAAANDPEDFPRLVAAIRDAQSPTATDHVNTLSRRTKDERLADALFGLLTDPPYQGGQSKRFYSAVVEGLSGTKRTDVRDQMIALAKRYKSIMGSFLGEYISSRLANTAAKMTVAGEPAAKGTTAKAAKLAHKPAAKPTIRTQQKDALFDEIVADIANDAPRSVYADMLVDKGDVRGEFIALQLARTQGHYSRAQAERERELLSEDEYIDRFAVPLSTAAEAVTFARGFPVAIHLGKSGLATVVDEPEWGTVEKLTNVHAAPISAVVKLIDGGHVPNLRTVATVDAKLLAKLKTPTPPWTAIDVDHAELEIEHLARMPALRRVAFTGRTPVSGAWLAALPAVETMSFRTPPESGALAKLRALRRVTLPAGTSPDAIHGLPLVEAEVTGSVATALGWIAAVPSLTSLFVHDREAFKPEFDWAALARVLATPALESLTIKRFVGIMTARLDRLATGWALSWPTTGERWVGFYEELATLAKPFRAAGVTRMTVYPNVPLHYAARFDGVDHELLLALDKAWKPIDVARPDSLTWPSGEAPQEGWVMGRTRGFPSR